MHANMCMSGRNACIRKTLTQEDICKKDVVTFGCVGKEIIGMMEIWAQSYAHTLSLTHTHANTHTNLFPWHTREENIEILARRRSMGLCGLMV